MQRLERDVLRDKFPEIQIEVRRESRFMIAADQTEEARELLRAAFERQPYSGQIVQTIYYATREFKLPRNGFIRERNYLTEPDSSEPSHKFLEIKTENREGEVVKSRIECGQWNIDEVLYEFGGEDSFEILVQMGLKEDAIGEAMEHLGACPLLPIVETISQRDYFGSDGQRITLDVGEQCWGYFEEDRKTRLLLKEEPAGRLEIKSRSGEVAKSIKRKINTCGIGMESCGRRREEFQYLYFAKMEELSEQKALREFTYEVPGCEIEAKLQVTSERNPLLLADSIFLGLSTGLFDGFGVMPGKEVVKEWEFRFVNYGRQDEDGLEEAVVVVIDPEMDRFAVKRKNHSSVRDQDSALVRPEVVDKHFGRFEGDLKARVLGGEEERIGCQLVEVGEVLRRKRYTYMTNLTTGRNYKVGVDVCRSNGHQMSQLEIEYMGRTGIMPIEDGALSEIQGEIGNLSNFVQEGYDDRLSLTDLTKFQWLVSLNN